MIHKRAHKYKRDRSLGVLVSESQKSSFIRKKSKPGSRKRESMHSSPYADLLHAKQKINGVYSNMNTKQLRNLVVKNYKYKNYVEVMYLALESRLDRILRNSGIASSMTHARQLINHKKVVVFKESNGVKEIVYLRSPGTIMKNQTRIHVYLDEKTYKNCGDRKADCMSIERSELDSFAYEAMYNKKAKNPKTDDNGNEIKPSVNGFSLTFIPSEIKFIENNERGKENPIVTRSNLNALISFFKL